MKEFDIYLYGMTLVTSMNLLVGDYPEADSYAEIKESYILPGGETGSCSVVLAALGCTVKIDGNFQGLKTIDVLNEYLVNKYGVDMTRVYKDPSFDGVQDLMIIASNTRTCFGRFGAYFDNEIKRWNVPVKEDILNAKVIGLDPFFMEQSDLVASYCHELGKKYVTIDCTPETLLHRYSEVNVVSNEFIKNNFPGEDLKELFNTYTKNTGGLVIFTFGAREIMFGRKGEPIHSFKPYSVKVQSTLGAGDTFKAGVIYGVLKDMSDEEIVKFAAATAGTVCSRFPMALNPPSLEMIYELINKA